MRRFAELLGALVQHRPDRGQAAAAGNSTDAKPPEIDGHAPGS
jgi:hypothetical protein